MLGNPNNPTGRIIEPPDLEAIIGDNPQTLFVIDETYLPFHISYERLSAIRLIPEHNNLLVVTSLSKIFAVPGLRIGFVAGPRKLITRLRQRLTPYGVGSLALALVPGIVSDREYLLDTQRQRDTEAIRVQQRLESMCPNIAFYPSQANFFLVENKVDASAKELVSALDKIGIRVKNCDSFPGLDGAWIRFALRSPEDNDRLLAGLAQFTRTACDVNSN